MSPLKEVSSNKCFGGYQKVYSHFSRELSCEINFAAYLPGDDCKNQKYPVLYYLSGLTCNELNCVQKSGFQRYAAEHGIIVICPDTSPRNIEGLDTSSFEWDYGIRHGFYVDATTELYKKNFRMYSYVTTELVEIVNANFPVVSNKKSISGHSVGGNGAIICALRNPGHYQSVSVLAPVSNPMKSELGRKAFTDYLGTDEETWKAYDATELVAKYNGPPLELFIDQGAEDEALKNLMPENLVEAAKKAQMPFIYKFREGYNHGYFFVATFIGEHLAYHAKFLK